MRWTQGPQVAAVAMVGGVMEGGTRKSGKIRNLREEETAVGRGFIYTKNWPRHVQGLKNLDLCVCLFSPPKLFQIQRKT